MREARILTILSALMLPSLWAQFALPSAGCPMAHCDWFMSDKVVTVPPLGPSIKELWQDPDPKGSRIGLGCGSNGEIIACAYAEVEVSHQHTREQERQMPRFKSMAQAQRFLSVHGPIQNLFRVGRHRLQAIHHRLIRETELSLTGKGRCVHTEGKRLQVPLGREPTRAR